MTVKSWNKMPVLDKRKTGEYILTGLLAAFVLATVLFPIRDLDQITTLGNEIQYWGGTMSILGQDWSQYMDGQAMVSYGYSLILVPICLIFKNPTFAYKAAIILNGFVWALAYLCSVKVGKKLLKDMNHYISVIGCFLIYLLPIYGESRVTIGPQPFMILLFWICVDIVCETQSNKKPGKLILLGICLVVLTWLDITMAVVFVGTTIYLYAYVKRDELEENDFLKWVLFVLVGICVGYFAEQVFLYHIFDAADINYSGSIQILFDKIISNWTNEGFIGLIYALFGKLYSLSINTFCLFLPVIYMVVKEIKKRSEVKNIELCPATYTLVIVSIMILFNAILYMGVSSSSCRETIMFGTLSVVIGPVLLLAIKELLQSEKWMEESIGYVTGLIITTFVTSHIFKSVSSIAVDSSFGFFNYAYQNTGSSQGMIYYCTVMALIAFLLICCAIKMKTKWNKVNRICTACGALIFAGMSFYLINNMVEYVVERQDAYTKYQQVADVLNSIEGEIYCDSSDASLKSHLFVIQMLANECDIILLDDDQLEEKKIQGTFITSSPYYNWEDEFEGYEPNCQIRGVIVWSPAESDVQEKVDNFLTTKEYKATIVQSGSKSSYGEGITLTPGTYVAKFYVEAKDLKKKSKAVNFSVKAGTELLQSKVLSYKEMKKGEEAVIELEFAVKETSGDIMFYVTKAKKVKLGVDKVTYQKVNSDYVFGTNCSEDLEEITNIIDELNQEVGKEGTVLYLEETEKLGDEDYIICNSKLSFCYSLLKTHTILYRNDAYTLLSPTGSEYCVAMEELQGFSASVKNTIDFRTFLTADKKGNYDLSDSFKLESGDYRVILTLKLLSNENNEKELGVYRIKNGSKRLAGKKILAKEFDDNIYEISLPLILYNDCNAIHYVLNLKDGVEIEVLDAKVRMNAAKYAIGSETDLSSFAAIINKTDENARVSYWTQKTNRDNDQHSLEYLESILPKCSVEMNLYGELMDEKGDLFVITRRYSKDFFKLVSKYTIIAQEGRYLLWARSNGSYIIDAMKNGATMLSRDGKISAELLASIQGREFDGSVNELSDGTYRFYIKIELTDVVEGDTLEVRLARDKTKNELKEEIEALEQESGYSSSNKEIDNYAYSDAKTYKMSEMSGDSLVIYLDEICSSTTDNLRVICNGLKGTNIFGKIIWIELL